MEFYRDTRINTTETLTEAVLNISDFHPYGDTKSHPRFTSVLFYMDLYFVPILIVIGLIGNTLSFIVFTCSHFKRLSSR